MRVPVNELLHNSGTDIPKVEHAQFLLDLRMEHHLQKEVSEFLTQRVHVLPVDGIQHLVCFFQKIAAQRFVCLFRIPRAAAGCAQAFHHALKPFQTVTGKLLKRCGTQDKRTCGKKAFLPVQRVKRQGTG